MNHGTFRVVIPARYGSTRLPAKVLRDLAGRTMLEHVWTRARSSGAAEVVVATDDERVAGAAHVFGADVCMTHVNHASGTDRVNEVVQHRRWGGVVVNLQGDEPLMPPALVAQVAAALIRGEADVATACVPISDESEWRDPNVVKVVRDSHGQALYFSRAPIPYNRDGDAGTLPAYGAFRHIGIYAYRTPVLARLADTAPCALEVSESLEQLRAQWLGLRLAVVDACEPPGPGVDTEADLTAVQKIIGDTKVAS